MLNSFNFSSDSEEQDSDIDNPCLTEGDRIRREHRRGQKEKPKLSQKERQQIIKKNKEKQVEHEKKKKEKQEKHKQQQALAREKKEKKPSPDDEAEGAIGATSSDSKPSKRWAKDGGEEEGHSPQFDASSAGGAQASGSTEGEGAASNGGVSAGLLGTAAGGKKPRGNREQRKTQARENPKAHQELKKERERHRQANQAEREKIQTILYEVQEEEDFIQFFAKFQKLKDEAQTEEILENIEAESDFGNCEYKLMFHKPTMDRVNHLQTQMRFRLNEGHGHAMYKIGVTDYGEVLGIKFEQMKETLSILFYMARNQDAKIEVQKVRRGTEENGFFTELTLDRNILRDMKQSIKITMLGCEASGKSTLIGVLVSGAKDNGQGLTREYVHKHIQEIVHGKTTKIYHHIVGFNSNGEVTNLSRFLTMPEIIQDSAKIITFIDVGGNQRYAKTLMRGLCDHYPDYALIVVDALNCAQKNIQFEKSVLDNFRIAFQFEVPVVVVLSKIDALWNQDVLEDIVYELRTQIWEIGRKVGNVIHNKKDIVLVNRQMQSQIVCPIFCISNKTHEGIKLFKNFLHNLQFSNRETDLRNQSHGGEFHIQQTFNKSDELIIVAGIVHKGVFRINQKTLMGPNSQATFSVVEIKSIHCNRVPVQSVKAGQMCSILVSLKYCEKWLRQAGGDIRKGMVLLDYKDKIRVQACFSFKADIWSFDGTIQCIKKTMQPVLLTQQVSQSCAFFLEEDRAINQYRVQTKQQKKQQRGRSASMLDQTEQDSENQEGGTDADSDIQEMTEQFRMQIEKMKMGREKKEESKEAQGLEGRGIEEEEPREESVNEQLICSQDEEYNHESVDEVELGSQESASENMNNNLRAMLDKKINQDSCLNPFKMNNSLRLGRKRTYSNHDNFRVVKQGGLVPSRSWAKSSLRNHILDSLGPDTATEESRAPHPKPEDEKTAPQDSNEFYIYPDKKTTLIFQFLYNPEYINVGNKIIINTDNFKAFGQITQIIPEKIDEAVGKNEKAERGKQNQQHQYSTINASNGQSPAAQRKRKLFGASPQGARRSVGGPAAKNDVSTIKEQTFESAESPEKLAHALTSEVAEGKEDEDTDDFEDALQDPIGGTNQSATKIVASEDATKSTELQQ